MIKFLVKYLCKIDSKPGTKLKGGLHYGGASRDYKEVKTNGKLEQKANPVHIMPERSVIVTKLR